MSGPRDTYHLEPPNPGAAAAEPTPADGVTPMSDDSDTVAPFPSGFRVIMQKALEDGTAPRKGMQAASDPTSVLAPAQGPGEIGRLGHYRVLKLLGEGGMGYVFEAEDSQLRRRVALKTLKPLLALNPSACQRFFREAQAMAALRHDHVVTIYQVGQEGNVPFFAMELLEGRSLADRLKSEKTLPPGEVVRLGEQMAAGLEAAHRRGLIHRDIKPDNIWLEPRDSDRVKLLDFGLARPTESACAEQLTQVGMILGTPAYMAPEQKRGAPVDERSDLFSLGVVLFRMLSGELPYQRGDSRRADPPSWLSEGKLDLDRLGARVPEGLRRLVAKLLAIDPADRCASAAQVRETLAALHADPAGATLAWTQDRPAASSDTARLEGARPEADRGEAPAAPRLPTESTPAPEFPDYELVAEIARGGMGVVYKARQKSLDRIVALKMILGSQLGSAAAVQRFQREARAAAGLDHPHIVPIYEIGEAHGHHYFTMAYVEGESLKSRVARDGPPPLAQAVQWTIACAEAVAYAHDRGIIHRDLKPDNVMIDARDRPRVTDFGLAKSAQANDGLTAPGQILGTPAYMAPEQALGGERRVGPEADTYALGGLLYYLLTGQAPFMGATVTEVLCQVVTQAPRRPGDLRPDIPVELEAICLKCLSKDPAQRYVSASALASALRAHAAASPGRVQPRPADIGAVHQAAPQPAAPPPPGSTSALRRLLFVAAGAPLLAVGIYFWNASRTSTTPKVENPSPSAAEAPLRLLPLAEARSKDFELQVDLVGSKPGPDGLRLLAEGDQVSFRVKMDRDAYLMIFAPDKDGKVVRLFPNKHDTDHFFKGGEVISIPTPRRTKDYVVEATLSRGVESLTFVASSSPLDHLFEADSETVRGFVLKLAPEGKAARVVDGKLLYKVVSR